MRRQILTSPFPDEAPDQAEQHWWIAKRCWPCDWVAPADLPQVPVVITYRCSFALAAAQSIVIHCSADERYDCWLDGQRVGQGPERSDCGHWAFETYDLDCPAGEHCLLFRVWSLPGLRPWAQCSLRHGLICAPEDPALVDVLGTGVAPWEWRQAREWSFLPQGQEPGAPNGMGPGFVLDASAQVIDWQLGGGDDWQAVTVVENGNHGAAVQAAKPRHVLRPAWLPEQERRALSGARVLLVDRQPLPSVFTVAAGEAEAASAWQALLDGTAPLTVAAGERCRVVIDLGAYACWLPEVVAMGDGALIDLLSCEAMCDAAGAKHGRDRIDGLQARGLRDRFRCGPTACGFEPLWWRAGRYLVLAVEAGPSEALTISGFRLLGVGYPLQVEAKWTLDRMADAAMADTCLRTLRCCMHETFMDCPYYEQLQYIGDTRIQAQLVYALTHDDRLQRAAIRHFDHSRNPLTGLTASNHPASSGQCIPPFSLWWIGMLHDFLLWRGEREELRRAAPGMRSVLDTLLATRAADGLPRQVYGWHFLDSEGPGFRDGVPPGGEPGQCNTSFTWHLVWALDQAVAIETFLGEPELAARWRRLADELATRIHAVAWSEDDGCYAEAPRGMIGHEARSPHAQILALLSGRVPAELQDGLIERVFADDLGPVGIMFSHYLFSLATSSGRLDAVRPRWQAWRDALADGFTTFPETWGQTRSDCHAWSAHPLYHLLTGVAGIQPATPGFARAMIAPQPADGECIDVALPHPGGGAIGLQLTRNGERLSGSINLPEHVPATVRWRDQLRELSPGTHQISIG